jgi:hypothetical protein
MVRSPKRPKTIGMLRFVLASNVAALLPIVFSALPDITSRQRALAKNAHTSLSTIQRICDGQVGATIDTIEFIARALNTTVTDLLTPSDATRRAMNISRQ